ncbi:MAG: DJ-1/PfpI family protein [candidate division Zixibacteria bacterium]|nr:DJ-1/PfpI family protein [candidate division Zixibacteria bacterium]
MIRKVAIMIFSGVEILDFAGPYEVFASDRDHFEVFTVAPNSVQVITGTGAMKVTADYLLDHCPKFDILVIPGGDGTRTLLRNKSVISFIIEREKEAEIILSVCTGSYVLARTGLLDGLETTTHHSELDNLEKFASKSKVRRDKRYVDNGKIICAAGVSSGIDASLYVIERLHGKERADRIADYIEHIRRDS